MSISPHSVQLTGQDARESLNSHVQRRGAEIHEKHGPRIGWNELLLILADRASVRYPCDIVFDSTPLQAGELAHPVPKGERPEDGFLMHVHPFFSTQPEQVPLLVLYQLVVVNYGMFASSEDAETFGSSALGISQDDYYAALCRLADQLASA